MSDTPIQPHYAILGSNFTFLPGVVLGFWHQRKPFLNQKFQKWKKTSNISKMEDLNFDWKKKERKKERKTFLISLKG